MNSKDDATSPSIHRQPRRIRVLAAAQVPCECMVLASNFKLSTFDVSEGPRRRLELALVALAYAAIAGLVWSGRRMGPWRKLTTQIMATVVMFVLAYGTGSMAPNSHLLSFIYVPWYSLNPEKAP